MQKVILSLYDFTGEAVKPWAQRGYACYCFDIQHDGRVEHFDGGGSITYRKADLHSINTILNIQREFEGSNVMFGMGFPVCTDLAVSGAAHFKRKREANPDFQWQAATYAIWVADLFETLGCPYFVENPVSVLATLWRKPDYSFHPYEYGGWIPADQAEHPRWAEYIAPFDAYSKKTCLWAGNGFKMPIKAIVPCQNFGKSTQHSKLGGKSMKTKNIRSATPRGFALAVFHANKGIL